MHMVVVGAQKSGTTWLYAMLRQHPQIGFSHMKEAHYFDALDKSDLPTADRVRKLRKRLKRARGLRHQLLYPLQNILPNWRQYYRCVLDENTAYTDEWYQNIFDKKPTNMTKRKKFGDYVRADFSPRYMTMSEKGIAHLGSVLNGQPPTIIIRDPVARAVSSLSMSFARVGRTKPIGAERLSKAFDEDIGARGDYARALPLLLKQFPNLKIIPFKHISREPVEVLRAIENDLGIERFDYAGLTAKRNSHSGKLRINKAAMSHLKEQCEPQYAFLKTQFGSQFLTEI